MAMQIVFLILSVFFLVGFLYMGSYIIPHQEVWIVQRLGKFHRKLEPGANWIFPFIDEIAYRHCLKEESVFVPEQTAITQDNVSVILDGIVYVKIVDPVAASYGVKDPIQAVIQLVQTTMRSEIGTLPLDQTFEERESLNARIVEAINSAATSWGIRCLRYEIKDIKMPEDIRKAMELQMTAEREKRAHILKSEGLRQSKINESEGQKQAEINIAEGAQIDRVNRARGEAEAIEAIADATARSIERLAQALNHSGGDRAAALQIAEKYIEAFRQLAKEGNTIVLPSNLQHPATMVAEALSIYDHVKRKPAQTGISQSMAASLESNTSR
jgi:regulator of protease activity HflC (stomatin/prohibitin superfamily)